MLSRSTVKGNGKPADAEQCFLTRVSETKPRVIMNTFPYLQCIMN